jgi:hypothetical protein
MEKAQTCHASLKQRLAGINRQASNRQAAEVLGIPKGMVDSTLSTMKRKAERTLGEGKLAS